jgi:hypothetical protein
VGGRHGSSARKRGAQVEGPSPRASGIAEGARGCSMSSRR